MKLSIVIPVLNEERYLPQLLEDVSMQTLQPFEVIVVDGKSEDRTVEVAKEFSFVKVIPSDRGVSHQRNVGGSAASGDVICFLDADTRLDPEFLERIQNSFTKRKLDVACPLFLPYKSSFIVNFIFWFLNIIFILFQKMLPSGAGPCIVIKKNIFEASGKFDEHIKFEDMEFIRRVGRKYSYGIIMEKIYVSDRRFKKNGVGNMILLYIILSFLFVFGMFKTASRISYPFGEY